MPNLFRSLFVNKAFLGPSLMLDPGHLSSPLSLKYNGSFSLYIILGWSWGSELAKVPRTKSPKDIPIIKLKFFIAVCPRFKMQLKNHLRKSCRSGLTSVKCASQQNWDHMVLVCTAHCYFTRVNLNKMGSF